MSKTNFEMVQEFHRAFGVESPEGPRSPDADLFFLRGKLIFEEVQEFVSAHRSPESGGYEPDLVEIADAIGDILYVVYGTADTYGLDADAIFREVHRSNMSKLDRDGKPIFREDGKILKGEDFSPPDLKKVIYEN